MSDIFQEVDEEVRQDEMMAFLKKWGPFVGAVFAIIVLVAAGIVFWREQTESGYRADSAAFADAVAEIQTDPQATLQALAALEADATPGYGALAALGQAAVHLEDGDWEAAVDVYDRLAANDAYDRHLRDYASLMAAYASADHADPQLTRLRLEELAGRDNTWSFSARELLALLDYRAGDLDAAESALNELAFDLAAPPGLKQRAQEMLGLIDSARIAQQSSLETAVEVPEETPEEAAPAGEDGQ